MRTLSKTEITNFEKRIQEKIGKILTFPLCKTVENIFEEYYTIAYEGKELLEDISLFLKNEKFRKIYFYPSIFYETTEDLIKITELDTDELPSIYNRYITDIILCPEDISFIILHSHENFFTFAGSKKFIQKFRLMFPKYKKFEDKYIDARMNNKPTTSKKS